ncbi:MCE family protein [Taurinivorans muris]|uniref:MCE family protein n=1 Tax=Taurinivorans muris TaxID=2787751 RepID=A0ABY5Y274_9BACT|nr:MlaD family protein [Mailhella sp.]UWX06285.1 MCE family protein [Desulfovibrionaceae bacterium LT0009]
MFKNKTVVGAFVFGSIVLVCLAFFLLGYGNYGTKQSSFALFFDSSLRGLNINSPVFFNGVPVGRVRSIYIVPTSEIASFKTVVIIELNENSGGVDSINENHNFLYYIDDENYVYELIDKGLRAKLTTASLITGQLVVDLVMVNDPEPLSQEKKQKYEGIVQIPTLPNVFESILSNVEDLPIRDISKNVLLLLENANTALAEINVPEMSKNLNAALAKVNELENETKNTVLEYRKLAQLFNHAVPAILKYVDRFAKNGSRLTQDDSAFMQEVFLTLQSLRDAANSISHLAELLENQPDALIFGKAK